MPLHLGYACLRRQTVGVVQEPDEDDLDEDDDAAPADVAAAARAAGIDVRQEGAAAEDGAAEAADGDAAMLNVQEMRRDAFWLQRRISRAMPDKEADAAQQLSESVFAALQASSQFSLLPHAGIRQMFRNHLTRGSLHVSPRTK